MCDCCNPKTFFYKLAEPSVWFSVLTAIIAYVFQLWIRMVWKRREQSALAALYLYEIKMEVDIGIRRLEYLYTHAGQPLMSGDYRPIMPTQNWTGVRDIFPDDIHRRLCNVARHERGKEMELKDLRFHLKNYYTVICKFGNDVILGRGPFDQAAAREDLDGARMVSALLENARVMMEKNAKRILWPR